MCARGPDFARDKDRPYLAAAALCPMSLRVYTYLSALLLSNYGALSLAAEGRGRARGVVCPRDGARLAPDECGSFEDLRGGCGFDFYRAARVVSN